VESLPEAASVEEQRQWLEQLAAAFRESRKDVHEATGRLPRLELLFGVGSPTASAAANLMNHLHRMSLELQKEPTDIHVFNREFQAAAEASDQFHAAANLVVARSWWYQHRHR
jgi:hypothetical protein